MVYSPPSDLNVCKSFGFNKKENKNGQKSEQHQEVEAQQLRSETC